MIQRRFLLFFSIIFFFSSFSIPEKENIAVYIFLGEECVISQHYTLQLKELHARFANENITFKGYFPNPNSTEESIEQFKEKYTLPFDLKLDKAQLQMMKFGVTVTPEVIIFKPSSQEILYQGRIDNTYFKVGKRRRVTTTFELENALKSIQKGEEITVQQTEVIGCFITPLDPNFKGIPMCQPEKGF